MDSLEIKKNEIEPEPVVEVENKENEEPIKKEIKRRKTLKIRKTNKENLEKFYLTHPEKKLVKIKCPICFYDYSYFNKSKHNKSAKHLAAIEWDNYKNELTNKKKDEQ